MSKKAKPIRLLDIVPGQVYMVRHYRDFTPVTIMCDPYDKRGWQRGQVRLELRMERCPTVAYGKRLNTNHDVLIPIRRRGDEFYFEDYMGPTLYHARGEWFDRNIEDLEAEIFKLNVKLNDLRAAKAEYERSKETTTA